MRNYFITFEGLDGAGKGTQIKNLIENIQNGKNNIFGNKYTNIWLTREPTKVTESGKEISEAIKKGVDGITASKLFVQDRIEHSKLIKDILNHSYVICDRYDISTLGYQMTQGIEFETLYNMHKYGEDFGTLIPDITIFLKISAKKAYERIISRGEDLESYEKIDFLEKLEMNYIAIIEDLKKRGRKLIEINAEQTPQEVSLDILKKLGEIQI